MRDLGMAGELSLTAGRRGAERARAVSDWGRGGGILALAAFVVLLLALVLATTASAATTLTVNTTADSAHVSGDCAGQPGDCSLRQAIYDAAGTGDTVIVPSGTYTLSLGYLDVAGPMTISGAGARTTTINRTGTAHRIFAIEGSGEVDVSGVTVSDGDTSGDTASAFGGCDGGGFYVDTGVTLALSDATVSNNLADCSGGGSGGGIYLAGSGASVMLSNTTLTGNTTGSCGSGGALYTFGGTINATNSTISGNDSECSGGAYGGGVVVVGASSLTLRNVTLASNSDTVGSGVDVGANLAMVPSGGPTYPTVSIRNTIIAHGVPAADGNCGTANSGPIPATSVGHNISDDATCGFTASGDQQNVHPLLGALANNGGQTDTRALLAGSPAIDAGGNTGCPATDQRGVSRPRNGNGGGIAICDVGAFEVAAPIVTTGSANHVTRTRASVGGSVNPNSRDASFRIQYGTSTAYGSQTQVQDAGSGDTAVALRAKLSGLKPGTKYHYRAVATNGDGTSHGVDRTFTTLPNPPGTEITKATISSQHHKASFSFKAIRRASGFQCALIKRNQPKPAKPSFSSCSSPKNYTNLKHGSYSFLVRAFNAGGFDPTPAKRTFQIT